MGNSRAVLMTIIILWIDVIRRKPGTPSYLYKHFNIHYEFNNSINNV